MDISVVIPAHNPDAHRLHRVLTGLRAQSAGSLQWETILVDNASAPAIEAGLLEADAPARFRVVREAELGLSHARARGFAEARAPIVVLVDDDNVLAPDYLAQAAAFLAAHPGIGAIGGSVLPEFEADPSRELAPFTNLLALRDLGDAVLAAPGFLPGAPRAYPPFAPIGAGMVLTRAGIEAWLAHWRASPACLTDRKGGSLSSSGDNDVVLAVMSAGLGVAYLPSLSLTHLIPRQRVEAEYLARLNFGIQKSWMQVLTLHQACPWPPLTPLGARLRQLRSWLRMKPWRSPADRIRFAGACGHFAGRVRSS